jgi:hypothetical protein
MTYSMDIYTGNIFIMVLAVTLGLAALPSSCAQNTIPLLLAPDPAHETKSEGKDVSILQSFNGDYPVAGLEGLPSGQEKQKVGYIRSVQELAHVWQAMFPSQPMPEIDFTTYIVVFSRNMHFYNRTSIGRVDLKDGVAEVLAMETMSSLPIEEKVAMALAVIPREGVKFIHTGTALIPVTQETSADPLNAVYTVEGHEVRLFHGRAEKAVAQGSATKVITSVFGKPVYGDLDHDGNDDAALILAREPGGSGIFYYVAVSINVNGSYRGTNAVLLGDRIVPRDVGIHNGKVVVRYIDRGPRQAMTAQPSVGQTKYLKLEKGILEEIEPLSMQSLNKMERTSFCRQ